MSSVGVKEVPQVSSKELMSRPKFFCSGSFVRSEVYEPDNSPIQYRIWFDFVGGQMFMSLSDSLQFDSLNLSFGELVKLNGYIDYNSFDGSIRLFPEKFISSPEVEVQSVRILGYGEVVLKDVSKFNKESYYKAALRFSGGLHLFTKLTPQVYSQIPPKGSSVRFQCGLQPYVSRTRDGQTIQKLGFDLQAMELVQFVSSPVSSAPKKAS
jgi:hypothetical protein